jgi:dsDNA-specific endonuclease/ATPase MutS2
MEIFTPEFREELMGNLETITIGLKSDLPINKVKELNDKINLAVQKEREIANPKKKKKNQFEIGDVVYFGTKKGEVISLSKEISDFGVNNGIVVSFCESKKNNFYGFKNDGSVFEGQGIFLSRFPYKLKMKKIK